jgi:hypothetical protein
MRSQLFLRRSAHIVGLVLTSLLCSASAQDRTTIRNALGANGLVNGSVLHFDLVRSDLSITVNNQPVDPAEVANGYVNFKRLNKTTYFADGSLPAQEAEVPALEAALRKDTNIHISAVVNHAALEMPKLLWVHFEAEDTAANLTTNIAAALATINSPQKNVTAVPITSSQVPSQYQAILKQPGATITQLNGAVYEVVIGRPDESRYWLWNVHALPALGIAETFYVQPLTGSTIVLNAEFALDRPEVQPVLDALKTAGFVTPALHDHFINDHERLFFLHGMAMGDVSTLANALATSLSPIYKQVH